MIFKIFLKLAFYLGIRVDGLISGFRIRSFFKSDIDDAELVGALMAKNFNAPSNFSLKGEPRLDDIRRQKYESTIELIKLKKFEEAIEPLKFLASLDVSNSDAFVFYMHVFRRANKEVIDAVDMYIKKYVVLHMTCVPRYSRAVDSCKSFGSVGLSNLIVVGGGEGSKYSFDAALGVLTVPAGDAYEFLPQKMIAAGRLLLFCNQLKCILKVDDDHRLHSLSLLGRAFRSAECSWHGQLGDYSKAYYYGDHIRSWHIGKCKTESINSKVFSQIGTKIWANGASGYFLNKSGLRAIFWADTYFSDYIEGSLYEDMLLSDIIKKFGGGVGSKNMRKILRTISDY